MIELGILLEANSIVCVVPTIYGIALNSYSIGISLIALIISIDILAIGVIINRLSNGRLVNWLGSEALEIAKSAILIGIIYSVIMLVSSITLSISPVSPQSFSQTATNGQLPLTGITEMIYELYGPNSYLNESCNDIFAYSASKLLNQSQVLGVLKSSKIDVVLAFPFLPTSPAGFDFGFVMNPYVNRMLDAGPSVSTNTSLINDFIVLLFFPIGSLILAEFYLLPLIIALALEVLLPLGIFLRAMPFTRSIGGTVVAISIGVGLIYPSLLLLFNTPVYNVIVSSFPSAYLLSSSCGPWWCIIFNFFASQIGEPIEDLVLYINSIFPFINETVTSGMFLIVQYFLLPIDLLIGYFLTNAIAKSLGGTLSLSLGKKLKVV
ncbi:MAG: hypothetical protein QXL16_01175 [Candidatus Micrarchaeaceae archaeon]